VGEKQQPQIRLDAAPARVVHLIEQHLVAPGVVLFVQRPPDYRDGRLDVFLVGRAGNLLL